MKCRINALLAGKGLIGCCHSLRNISHLGLKRWLPTFISNGLYMCIYIKNYTWKHFYRCCYLLRKVYTILIVADFSISLFPVCVYVEEIDTNEKSSILQPWKVKKAVTAYLSSITDTSFWLCSVLLACGARCQPDNLHYVAAQHASDASQDSLLSFRAADNAWPLINNL